MKLYLFHLFVESDFGNFPEKIALSHWQILWERENSKFRALLPQLLDDISPWVPVDAKILFFFTDKIDHDLSYEITS